VVEVALAMVVLVGASLLVRSLNKLIEVRPGFRADHVLVARLALPANQYKAGDVQRFYARLVPKIAAIPGVAGASATSSLPLLSAITPGRFLVKDQPVPPGGSYPVAALASVDQAFFATMGIPILRGRAFREEEVGHFDDEPCIVSDTLARTYFGARDPVGRILLTNVSADPPEPCHIVGVAGDTRMAGLDDALRPVLYFAAYKAREILVVRTATDPLALAGTLKREVAMADVQQPLSDIQTMEHVVSRSLSRRSFAAVLLSVFSALGLVLASLGLYGLVSYSVAQRTAEIGVRVALGAAPSSICGLIVFQGLWVTAIGLAVGTAAAVVVTRAMSSLLFGIDHADPLSFGAGCGLLAAVSAVACLLPAYRAARTDPMAALRYQG